MRDRGKRIVAWALIGALSMGLVGAGPGRLGAAQPAVRDSQVPEGARPVAPVGARAALPALEKQPMQFEPNVGQAPDGVRYLARVGARRVLLTDRGAILDLRTPNLRPKVTPKHPLRRNPTPTETSVARRKAARELAQTGVVRMRFVDGATRQPSAELKLRGVVHYYLGRDAKHWRTEVPTFARVRYADVYPGVDVVYHGVGSTFDYDFIVAPGADPSTIRIAFDGAERTTLAANGDLRLTVAGQTIVQGKPDIFQIVDGVRRAVPGRYVMAANGEVRFALGSYVASLPLVIDPPIPLDNGSEGLAEKAVGDPNGNTYVTGVTVNSPLFTSTTANAGPATGTTLTVESTTGFPSSGQAFINGEAFTYTAVSGTTFTMSAPLGGTHAAGAVVIPGTGSPLRSTTMTTAYTSGATSIAVGSTSGFASSGTAFVNATHGPVAFSYTAVTATTFTGVTGLAMNFDPGTGVMASRCGAFPEIAVDAFVVKLDPDNNVLWKAIIGGRSNGRNDCSTTFGSGVALDSTASSIVVVGSTDSKNLVITDGANVNGTPAAFQTSLGDDPAFVNNDANPFYQSGGDGFALKLSTATGALQYSTYLGGSGHDFAQAVVIDSTGNAYVVGATQPDTTGFTFPSQYNAVLNTNQSGGGFSDIFIAKLNTMGSIVNFLTVQGGPGEDSPVDVTLNSQGEVIVTGVTASFDPQLVSGIRPDGVESLFASVDLTGALHLGGIEAGLSQCTPVVSSYALASRSPLGTEIPTAPTCDDVSNGFLAKFNAGGAQQGLPTAAYLIGAESEDTSAGVGVDASNNVYLTGQTASKRFIVKNPVSNSNGDKDPAAIVTTTTATVNSGTVIPVVSTTGFPASGGAFIDGAPFEYTGTTPTSFTGVTVAGTFQSGARVTRASGYKAFVVKIALPAGTTLATNSNIGYSSPLGGATGTETPTGIAVTPSGDVFLTGMTTSTDTAVLPPAASETEADAYLLKISASTTGPTVTVADQTNLGTVDVNAPPPALTVSTDIDGNIVIAGAATTESLGAKIVATITATIDIKPRAKKNNLNLSSRYVHVAILSTPFFDAPARVDPATLTFGATGDEASIVRCHKKGRNVNKDKVRDLVCVFKVADTAFQATDTIGTLKGLTFSKANIVGTDSIHVVPKKGGKPYDHDSDDAEWDNDD